MNVKNMPVRLTKCATCPFRAGSKYECLRVDLTVSALSENSRICHSTGSNGLGGRTGKPEHLCRGRDEQLEYFAALGVIEEASDEAWNKQRERIGMKAQAVKNP